MHFRSDHYNGKIYLNPVPTEVLRRGAKLRLLRKMIGRRPNHTPSVLPGPFHADLTQISQIHENILRIAWLGHSSSLIEIDGKRFLTDPVWYRRASPFIWVGPKRFFDNPIQINLLPPVNHILLSHDHYDHLDREAIIYLTEKGIPIITMLGVGDRLIEWGVSSNLVTQMDWWQQLDLGNGFSVTALPARHFSGRWLNDRFKTLWGSFAVKGPSHHVYFGADSGYYDGFRKIGEKLGPFDLTMLDIGAYENEWPWVHMGPENAIKAHKDLRGKLLMPIHWGTFPLAFHPWTEPIERLIKAAEKDETPLLIPAPGDVRDIADGVHNSRWWMTSATV